MTPTELKLPRKRRSALRVPWAIVVVFFAVLIAELGVRAIAPKLPRPSPWFMPEAEMKVGQMNEYSKSSRSGGVVFVGTSLMDVGVDPRLLGSSPDLSQSYNASLLGSDMAMLEWWTHSVVVPMLRPRKVVVGISSHQMNPNDSDVQLNAREFFRAPAVRRLQGNANVLERVGWRLEEWSQLLRYRKTLRSPTNILEQTGDNAKVRLSPEGVLQTGLPDQYNGSAAVGTAFRQRRLNRFEVGSAQLGSLRRMLGFLVSSGVDVVVVDMPVTQQYVSLHPHGARDYTKYQHEVEMLANESHVPFRSVGIWDERLFRDPYHLNRVGASKLTQMIAGGLLENAG